MVSLLMLAYAGYLLILRRFVGIPAIATTRSGVNRPAIPEDCDHSFRGESSTLARRPTRMVLFYSRTGGCVNGQVIFRIDSPFSSIL